MDQLIPWDEKQGRLSPGLRIKALVVNVLSHRRPLYKVWQAFQDYSIEEKIFELQQKKKALIDAVIQPGESYLSKMSEKDIRLLFEIENVCFKYANVYFWCR